VQEREKEHPLVLVLDDRCRKSTKEAAGGLGNGGFPEWDPLLPSPEWWASGGGLERDSH
jgi:hypothetical protein